MFASSGLVFPVAARADVSPWPRPRDNSKEAPPRPEPAYPEKVPGRYVIKLTRSAWDVEPAPSPTVVPEVSTVATVAAVPAAPEKEAPVNTPSFSAYAVNGAIILLAIAGSFAILVKIRRKNGGK